MDSGTPDSMLCVLHGVQIWLHMSITHSELWRGPNQTLPAQDVSTGILNRPSYVSHAEPDQHQWTSGSAHWKDYLASSTPPLAAFKVSAY